MKKLAVIETPYAPTQEDPCLAEIELYRNIEYVMACMADCFRRGEIPFASHALYTQPGVLDDRIPEERRKGMEAGFEVAHAFAVLGRLQPKEYTFNRVFYLDRGWSKGMREGARRAFQAGHPVEFRELGEEWGRDND